MLNVKINDSEYQIPPGMSVLQACELAGIEIPRFCYHDRLSIAGNCRMCLVEIKPGPPKPAASCAMPVGEGMEIFTDSEMVRKGRAGVMEFLLINHPLDCPICDQGGECDLQDQAMGFGHGISRYQEDKRSVQNKYMGPLINTIMTRCIHCTRCVRFASEIAGTDEIGLLNRGESAEISALESAVSSELSGNVIDLCPVGALTSRAYAFVARPWELEKTESIDVFDAVGSNIRIDSRGGEILRILPRLHEDINEEWISDKIRFSFDALRMQRLDQPWLRSDKVLEPCDWNTALSTIQRHWDKTKSEKIGVIVGDQVDCETMFAIKTLCEAKNINNIDCREDCSTLDNSFTGQYLFNTTISGLEQADVLILIGTNIRWEAPLIHARIRKAWLSGALTIAVIGEEVDFAFPYTYLGKSAQALKDLEQGKGPFATILKKAKNPALILGSGVLQRADAQAIETSAHTIAEHYKMIRDDWNGYNVLHRAASRVAGMYMDILPHNDGYNTAEMIQRMHKKSSTTDSLKLLWLVGVDSIDVEVSKNCFVIYQGHHGDKGAQIADVILPGAAFCEKEASWMNLEGRVQLAQASTFPPGQAREDWKIVRALAGQLGQDIGFDDLETLRRKMRGSYPHLAHIDMPMKGDWGKLPKTKQTIDHGTMLQNPMKNFYMCDAITRNSPTMAKCARVFSKEDDDISGNKERA